MELDSWLTKLKQAGSHKEVFAILDQFRTHDWTDEERSKIAKLYMRTLDNLGTPTSDAPAQGMQLKGAADQSKKPTAGEKATSSTTGATNLTGATAVIETEAVDEEVWYEKM
jgi:hypothetical protein